MSRRTRPDSTRTAELEAVRMQQRRGAHRRTAVIMSASVAVVGSLDGRSWAAVGGNDSGSSTSGKVALAGLQTYSWLAGDHVTQRWLTPQVPVGGAHASIWEN